MIIGNFNPENGQEIKLEPVKRTISVVLAKPTKACNADCDYCFALPYDKDRWTIEKFKLYFDNIEPYLKSPVQWIWHGGEPMLMGVQFYKDAEAYVKTKDVDVVFSMQSNLTLYDEGKWLDYIKNDLGCRISTSYDIDEISRTIKGDSKKYSERFFGAVDNLMNNKVPLFAIGVYDTNNIDTAFNMYDLSMKYHAKFGKGISFRINPKVDKNASDFESVFKLDPKLYADTLVRILDKMLNEVELGFTVTPIDSFIRFYYSHGECGTCPWTNSCAGAFISIEPNGDVYNCDDSVHFNGFEYKFGNLNSDEMITIMNSISLKRLKEVGLSRSASCMLCEFYYACKGGCDSMKILNRKLGNDIYPYCLTNKILFSRIKELDKLGYEKKLKKIAGVFK